MYYTALVNKQRAWYETQQSVDDTANVMKELSYVRCGYMQLSILNSDKVNCILKVLCTQSDYDFYSFFYLFLLFTVCFQMFALCIAVYVWWLRTP